MSTVLGANSGFGATETAAVNTAANTEKKDKIKQMKDALIATVNADPDFKNRVRRLSASVKVLNSLGFGDSGNIIVDKTDSSKEKRALAVTSAIVGYRVANIGEEPIKYVTEVYAQDASGKYVPTKQEKTLAPGAYADLTRQYMTMFCAQPEISFQLANGKIVKGAGAKSNKGMKAELEAHYFAFNKEADGTKKQVNDDDVKLNVGEKVDGKWVVKAEFLETFGYLNNPKESGKVGRRASEDKWTAQDLAANYIFTRLQQESAL